MADKNENPGVEFLKAELESAIAWAQLSQTEEKIVESEAAIKARAMAEEAYASFRRFRPHVEHRLTEKDRADISRLEAILRKLIPDLT